MTCPYCSKELRSNAAMAGHLRAIHPEKWRGNVLASIAPLTRSPMNETTQHKGGAPKGIKKKPIRNVCPFCGYKNFHPPGMARHIQYSHPDKWKGNLGESLGREPSRVWKSNDKPRKQYTKATVIAPEITTATETPREREERLKKKREYQLSLRSRYYSEGRNSRGEMMPPGWKPRGRKNQRIFNSARQPAVELEQKPEKPKGPALGHIEFCPNCGHNIRAYELAKGMMDITNA